MSKKSTSLRRISGQPARSPLLAAFAAFYLALIASAQATPTQGIPPGDFPFGSAELPEPKRYCFNGLFLQGDSKNTAYISIALAPVSSGHVGKPVDVFVGFRLRSQPDRVWLLSKDYVWKEYVSGSVPETVFYAPVELTDWASIFIQSSVFSNPPSIDLTAYFNDGEVMVGYGLRNGDSATVSDAFQEMLDNKRFNSVWWVEDKFSIHRVCLYYNKIVVEADNEAFY